MGKQCGETRRGAPPPTPRLDRRRTKVDAVDNVDMIETRGDVSSLGVWSSKSRRLQRRKVGGACMPKEKKEHGIKLGFVGMASGMNIGSDSTAEETERMGECPYPTMHCTIQHPTSGTKLFRSISSEDGSCGGISSIRQRVDEEDRKVPIIVTTLLRSVGRRKEDLQLSAEAGCF